MKYGAVRKFFQILSILVDVVVPQMDVPSLIMVISWQSATQQLS